MIDIYNKFKENKLTLFTTGFSIFTFLKDIEDVITHFFESIKYLAFAFVILAVFLIFNFFKYNKSCQIIDKETKNVNETKINYFSFINKFWIKIAIIFCTGFIIIGLLSISHIRNYPIYYVKIKDFKTKEEAFKHMNEINNSFILDAEYKMKARCLTKSLDPNKYPNGNFMVALNGGYLSKERALIKAARAKSILGNDINFEVTKPSKNISVVKKISYLIENN